MLITRGLLNSSLVHPREVFRAAIAEAAAGASWCTTIPAGGPTPSPEDRQVPGSLPLMREKVDLPLLDHVIVAGARFLSFATAGLL